MSYEIVCGLETHIELATESKIFCGCSTAFSTSPNTHCCPICMGQSGALPSLNKKVVEYAIRAGLALNCKINNLTHLDRKNYFYPDLPKAYQISQYDKPLCEDGYIALDSGKRIRIERIHIEEDAGKLIHEGKNTLIDYNRAGVPLIEIVSKPDIVSCDEAREFIEKLRLTMRAIGVSECKMQEGGLRCDVNVSIRSDENSPLGTRTEIKNMNSISHITQAISYEAQRQYQVICDGGKIEQATLRYDEREGKTEVMRVKEQAGDYRFFPEPDILPVRIPQEVVDKIGAELPELPEKRLERYIRMGISAQSAKLMYGYSRVCKFIEDVILLGASVKNTVNLTLGVIYSSLNSDEDKIIFDIKVSSEQMAELVKLVDSKKINITLAQTTLTKMLADGKRVTDYISLEDIQGVSDNELEKICRLAIAENSKAVSDFLGGKDKAISGLYGYIKRATKGVADIQKADKILRALLLGGLN